MSTNNNIKIAVIDSGISKDYLHNITVIDGIGFKTNIEKGNIEVTENYFDELGHGTECIDIINNNTENANFYVIKILDNNGYSSSKALELALEHLCTVDIDVINLSLSMDNAINEKIQLIIDKLYKQGKLIVASVKNGELSSPLANYKNVIGVIGVTVDNESTYEFNQNNEIQFKCSSVPILTKINDNKFRFFAGNSKATCIATSIIANLLFKYNKNNIDYIFKKLRSNSQHIEDSKTSFTLKFNMLSNYKNFNTSLNFNNIKDIFCNYFKISEEILLNTRLYEIKKNLNETDVLKLISNIEESENININILRLTLRDCEWIYSFIKYIENNIENKYCYSKECVRLQRGNRIILANNLNGESLKLSKECVNILDLGIKNELTFSKLISCLEDENDKDYFKRLFKQMEQKGLITDVIKFNDEYDIESVNINITHRCNLQCIHCSMSASTMQEDEKLTTEEWLEIIDKIISINPKSITISGGEPLVRKDIWKILNYIKVNYNGNMAIMTNSILINEDNIEKLKNIFDNFNISIDGVNEETCSKIRGKGVFKKVINNVKLLKKHGVQNISLSMVDVKYTHDYIQKFYALNKELGTFPMLRNFSDEGRGLENREELINDIKEDYNDLLILADEVSKKNPGRGKSFCCGAGRKQFHISYDGKLYPCAPTEYDDLCLGDLREIDDLKSYINSKEYFNNDGYKNLIKLMPNNNDYCCDCDVNMYCWTCLYKIYVNQKFNKNLSKKCAIKKRELCSIWEEN